MCCYIIMVVDTKLRFRCKTTLSSEAMCGVWMTKLASMVIYESGKLSDTWVTTSNMGELFQIFDVWLILIQRIIQYLKDLLNSGWFLRIHVGYDKMKETYIWFISRDKQRWIWRRNTQWGKISSNIHECLMWLPTGIKHRLSHD